MPGTLESSSQFLLQCSQEEHTVNEKSATKFCSQAGHYYIVCQIFHCCKLTAVLLLNSDIRSANQKFSSMPINNHCTEDNNEPCTI